MNLAIYLIVPYLGTIMIYFFMRMLLDSRAEWWIVPLVALPLELVAVPRLLLGMESVQGAVANGIGMVVGVIIVPLLLFRGPRWKRVLISMYYWTAQMLCDLLFAAYYIPKLGDRFLLWPTGTLLTYSVLATLLFILIASASTLALNQIFNRKFQPFYLLFLFFPLGVWLMGLGHLMEAMERLWFFGVLVSIAAQLMLLAYTVVQERHASLKQELEEVRHTMELEQAHYQMVEEQREELARIRHDFNNQLATIRQLVRMGEDEDAQRMIRHLTEEIGETRENQYCAVPVVNAVLTEKAKTCGEAGISLETELELPQSFCVRPLELCSAFANLLDNAIEGAAHSGEAKPWVAISSATDGDYLFIRTKNPAKAPPERPQPGHGYGTRILANLAAQYDGGYQTQFQDGLYTAVLSLAIRK